MNIRVGIAALAACTLALAGCGSDSLTSDPAPGGGNDTEPQVEVDQALHDMLPEKIKSSGTIVVGTDPSYAPNEFMDADGQTVIGMDVDLFDAVAAKLGVQADWQPSQFDSIIAGIDGNRYDTGVSSFTINDERKERVNMISYFDAGTQWASAGGNPKQVNPDDPCGLTVAVQTGTVQHEEDLPAKEAACGDNRINVLTFTGQDEATAALVSGRADALLADSPIVAYAVQQSGGKLEAVGEIYDSAPYGFVVPKDQTEYADAIAEALNAIKADGTYDEILEKWGNSGGAIDAFEVNP